MQPETVSVTRVPAGPATGVTVNTIWELVIPQCSIFRQAIFAT